MKRIRRNVVGLVVVAAVVGWSSPVISQGADTEPNDSCPAPQDFGAEPLPFTVNGELTLSDLDFFRVSAAPGMSVQVDHEGQSTGQGTLGDPLLGIFDSACNLIALNDDFGSLNSRVCFVVPPDGTFTVAATAFPDFGFTGSTSAGTYLVTIQEVNAGSVRGRLVDAATNAPLPGDGPPFAAAILWRCNEFGDCFDFVVFASADAAGNIFFGDCAITAGRYRVQVFANCFQDHFTEQFDLAEGENLDLGDIGLTSIPAIGSISGRVTDAQTGDPLPGIEPPFSFVCLEHCSEFGCFPITCASPDAEGRFEFSGSDFCLPAGTYRTQAFADGYIPGATEFFEVPEGGDHDVGDLALEPFPIRFGEVQTCSIPAAGGRCRYSVEVINSLSTRFRGQAWGEVFVFGTGSPIGFTQFQVGRVGAVNPMPQNLNLKPGQRAIVEFEVDIPGSLADGAVLCASILVGADPHPLYNTVAERFLFCVQKEPAGLSTLPEREGRARFHEQRLQRASSRPAGLERGGRKGGSRP